MFVKHILFIDDAHTFGGAQIALVNALMALDMCEDFKLSVILSENNTRLIDKISCISKVNIIRGPKAYPLNIFLFFLSWRKVRLVFESNDLDDVDVCIMNLPGIEFNLTYVFYLNRKRLHIIAWLHCAKRLSDLIINVSWIKNKLNTFRDVIAEKVVFSMYKTICLPTKAEKNVLLQRLTGLTNRPNLGVLNNVLNKKLLSSNKIVKANEGKDKCTIILVVGEINFATKGQDRTIGIAIELIKRGVIPYFMFVGSGDDADTLSERFIDADLHDYFQLVGWQPDITKWLQMASIVLITSRAESFSLVALEAMAMTKRIVASRLPCFDEVLPNECVLLNDSTESFSDSIEKSLSFDKAYLKNIYAPFIEKFSPDEFIKSFNSLLLSKGRK